MNKIALLLVLVVGLSLTSCGKQKVSQVCKECGEKPFEEQYNGYCEDCFNAAMKKAMSDRFAGGGGDRGAGGRGAGGRGGAVPGATRAPTEPRTEAQIFEAERLQIGMEVPDIEAEDVDGVKFKLSDYRGKVVVLDFWGDW